MRIVLDMQGAQTESRHRGIGRYSTALAQAIVRQAGPHEVWVVANQSLGATADAIDADFGELVPAHRLRRFEILGPLSWRDPSTPWRREASEYMREAYLRDLRPDMVHVSSLFEGSADNAVTSIARLRDGAPTAVTLYDLIPLLNPEYLNATWAREWYMSKVESLKRASLLLAISEHARQEGIDVAGLTPGNVVNISSAASGAFRRVALGTDERARFAVRFDLSKPFVMYSGAMDSRKNVEGLIAAFGQLSPDLLAGHLLLIAGKVPAVEQERLMRIARKHGISANLRFTGYIDDVDLVALYSQAKLYVFPSLHEGFGLPALEAMCCGVATIGSSTTSIPEVIGRSDALFDPTSAASIAERITQVLTDEAFADSLRAHAAVQSAKFSWDASARKAIEAFEARHDRQRSAGRTWSTVMADIETGHRSLVQAVASIHQPGSPPMRTELVEAAAGISVNRDDAIDAMRVAQGPVDALSWRVEGPFDSSYSLALVNRELALALSALGDDVALHSTEGPGDFPASEAFLATRPDVSRLHDRERSLPHGEADVASRLLYPPRVEDMRARFNLLHAYAWEESGFPWEWADAFNDHLQGISALSRHVEKILIDAGVRVPLSVSDAGVDHWDRIQAAEAPALPPSGFRFLHVSSCFPRKGADVMLRAYGDAFTANDDVCLVIKTFVNPHNEIHRWLAEAKGSRRDFPRVHIIEDDLDEVRLKALYEACDVLVAPSRAEGFGLPMAEAMISGLGVITTAWGGQLDFCNPDTAWLVDYRFEEATTHFGVFHSVWAEPDQAELGSLMRHVHDLSPVERARKVEAARALLRSDFTWASVARRVDGFARGLMAGSRNRPPRVGWVTTWNKRCGIASYSDHLVRNVPGEVVVFAAHTAQQTAADGPEVVRSWQSELPDTLELLRDAIDAEGIDTVVVQFQYGFFEFGPLADFLLSQHDAGRAVVVMMHATQDPPHVPDRKLSMLADALAVCDRVLVHGVADLNRLKDLGLVDNVAIFPHGIVDTPEAAATRPSSPASRFVIASYGFFLPHKGLPELVEAMALLVADGVDVELRMINAEYHVGESRDMIARTRAIVAERGLAGRVTMVTDYLDDADSLARLGEADLIVFPYQGTGESSSAAVRYGLAAGRPVAVTPISIFDDVGGAVHRLPGVSPRELASGIAALVADARKGGEARRSVEQTAARWRSAHRYSYLGRRLYNTLVNLSARRKAAEPAPGAP
ncbi:glycosyltransferase involved in cell wall biosynthesis [Luteibacter sp. HA06]